MTTLDKNKLAVSIKTYRKKNDLTLQELAMKIPTTLNTVYRWEAGKGVPKSQLVLKRLKEIGIKI